MHHFKTFFAYWQHYYVRNLAEEYCNTISTKRRIKEKWEKTAFSFFLESPISKDQFLHFWNLFIVKRPCGALNMIPQNISQYKTLRANLLHTNMYDIFTQPTTKKLHLNTRKKERKKERNLLCNGVCIYTTLQSRGGCGTRPIFQSKVQLTWIQFSFSLPCQSLRV